MRIKEVILYSFNELNDAAKEKAISNNYDINVQHDWWQPTYEDAEQIGLKITGFDLDRGNYVRGEFTLSVTEVAQNILNNHGENCETFKTTVKFMEEWQPLFDKYMETEEGDDKLMEIEEQYLNDICEDYCIILRNEYEYLTSDEAISGSLIANDYEFTEDGTIN